MLSPILELRKHSDIEEIDYVYVVSTLQQWAAPRNVISRLVKSGDLIRVKKGIYIFGPNYRKRPYSLEILANKIYGPSYISCEYALSLWGLIPEQVREITSVTTGKKKHFITPVGRFSYFPVKSPYFSIGVTLSNIIPGNPFLIATPEKSLIDLLLFRNEIFEDKDKLASILFDDLRIDPVQFFNLNTKLLKSMTHIAPAPLIDKLTALIKEKNYE